MVLSHVSHTAHVDIRGSRMAAMNIDTNTRNIDTKTRQEVAMNIDTNTRQGVAISIDTNTRQEVASTPPVGVLESP